MIYETRPENFNPKFEAVGCFVENNGKVLLLNRKDNKPQGNTWGLPSGKINSKEDKNEAMKRELYEETSLNADINKVSFYKSIFVKFLEYDFIYHIFSYKINKENGIKINSKEHKEYKWVEINKLLSLNLIKDLDGCIKLFYKNVI